jgi:hypothetical protein
VEESGNFQSKELSCWTRKTTNAGTSRAFVMFERARSFAVTLAVTGGSEDIEIALQGNQAECLLVA